MHGAGKVLVGVLLFRHPTVARVNVALGGSTPWKGSRRLHPDL